MDLLAEYTQAIRGLKIQAKVALSGLNKNNNLKVDKGELTEAHRLISFSPNILKSEVIKSYMKENDIESYPDIDLDDFKKFYNGLLEDKKYFKRTILSSMMSDDIMHFTDGIFKENNLDANFLETSNFSLCGKKIKGFGADVLTSKIANKKDEILSFIAYSDIDNKLENLCLECANHLGYNTQVRDKE